MVDVNVVGAIENTKDYLVSIKTDPPLTEEDVKDIQLKFKERYPNSKFLFIIGEVRLEQLGIPQLEYMLTVLKEGQ